MGDGHQVGFGRQFHGRMAPVAGGEDPQAAGVDERFKLGLHCTELGLAVAGPVRDALCQLGGLLGVGLEGRDHIDPVQGRQMVEMDDMVLHRVLGHDHVADVLGIERHLHLEGVLYRADRRDGVHRGADATEALGIDPGILGRAPLQDGFYAAPHLGRGPGVGDGAAVDFDIDAQMPFDAGDGIKCDSCHVLIPPEIRFRNISPQRHGDTEKSGIIQLSDG